MIVEIGVYLKFDTILRGSGSTTTPTTYPRNNTGYKGTEKEKEMPSKSLDTQNYILSKCV